MAMSSNNPYGSHQVPEWQLWEQGASARGKELVHENEAVKQTKLSLGYHEQALAIDAALLKLRPPEGQQEDKR